MNGLDLFSGIGGLSIALAPWVRPVAYCEIDRYAQAVLLSRMSTAHMRLAEEVQPQFIFLENVRNIRSSGLGAVAGALADCGYDCRWDILPAYEDTRYFEGERWFCLAKAIGKRGEAGRGDVELEAPTSWYYVPISHPVWDPNNNPMAVEDDGLFIWTHAVRALGNAVVPLQAQKAYIKLMGLHGGWS